MRSLTVVLPASICAMTPRLRIFSSGTALAMILLSLRQTDSRGRKLSKDLKALPPDSEARMKQPWSLNALEILRYVAPQRDIRNINKLTSGNDRRPYWLQPSCVILLCV